MPADLPVPAWHLRFAARVVHLGGIIAYPTESVFGLGCDPLNPDAVYRLLALKKRSEKKGLILISDRFERLQPYIAQVPALLLEQIRASWPGPVTWLMPPAPDVPVWLRGQHATLALRVTAHPIASALCRAVGSPLVSTSANLSQHPAARNALEVRIRCGSAVDFILHGATGGLERPTQIRDALSGKVIRK